ncbi:MAG: virulence RhuM family protein [bacterium]|jgi:hypothetical protein
MPDDPKPSEIILYQTADGRTRLDVRMEAETVWLTQKQLAELFDKDIRTVNEHIVNIFSERELQEDSVIRRFRITAADGKQYDTQHYNLDVIISVGYRVRSHRGTQFRQWATQRLREYLVKGFTLDDERLKKGGKAGTPDYFDELLARIRDIRSSEKVFWRKVLDIYATSVDYDPANDQSALFFKTVQNKMHWAAHGHTAAEVIARRADAAKPNMGLTNWPGSAQGATLRKADVGVAKNYLNKDELDALNLIVSFYLDFAELQAKSRREMTMAGWISKLDDFLRLSERDILTHAGKVSHDKAMEKAEGEYARFAVAQAALPSPVERHFDEAIGEIKRLEGEKKKPESPASGERPTSPTPKKKPSKKKGRKK